MKQILTHLEYNLPLLQWELVEARASTRWGVPEHQTVHLCWQLQNSSAPLKHTAPFVEEHQVVTWTERFSGQMIILFFFLFSLHLKSGYLQMNFLTLSWQHGALHKSHYTLNCKCVGVWQVHSNIVKIMPMYKTWIPFFLFVCFLVKIYTYKIRWHSREN